MQKIIKEVPKGFYAQVTCVVVPVGDNVKLFEEHHKGMKSGTSFRATST